MPYTLLHPLQREVMRAVGRAVDDRKRDVRMAAVRCRARLDSAAALTEPFPAPHAPALQCHLSVLGPQCCSCLAHRAGPAKSIQLWAETFG